MFKEPGLMTITANFFTHHVKNGKASLTDRLKTRPIFDVEQPNEGQLVSVVLVHAHRLKGIHLDLA